MIKIIQNKTNPSIDGLPYDKVTTNIKVGILTVKAVKVKKPSGKKVTLTIVTNSFAIFTEK